MVVSTHKHFERIQVAADTGYAFLYSSAPVD